jgi:hypothetical protein
MHADVYDVGHTYVGHATQHIEADLFCRSSAQGSDSVTPTLIGHIESSLVEAREILDIIATTLVSPSNHSPAILGV